MRTRLMWVFFSMAICAQLALPAWMIVSQEQALTRGKQLRVRCGILDPNDPFRGKFVALRFDLGPLQTSPQWTARPDETKYLTFTTDDKGFLLGEALLSEPPDGEYISLDASARLRSGLSCNRFYMDENLAPRADLFMRTTKDTVWASLRLYQGEVTLENIYVSETPLAQYLTEHPDTNTWR